MNKAQLTARVSVLFLVFVVLGVYYPAIFAPINSVDDPGTINFLLNVDSFSLRAIFTPGATYYRPLLLLSFMADKFVWGLQESFMHLENILFHLVNVLLLYTVARRCFRAVGAEAPLPPLLAALLFALHPINAEAVNWISGRTDLIACFFVLLSAFFLLGRRPGLVWSLLAALSLLAGCLAKETAIFFLPAALIAPFYLAGTANERRSLPETARQNWPHLAVFAVTGTGFFLFRSLASHHGDAGVARVVSHVAGAQSAAASVTLKLPLKAAGFYLKKLFVPFPLNFGIIHVSELYLGVGLLLCLLLVWLLTRRTLAAFFFICAASTAASALLVPLLNLTWTPLAERYMYIPSAFFALGLVLGVERWQHRVRFQRLVAVATGAVLLIACYGTASRTLLWQDNLALFRDTLKKSPGFVPAQNEIALALYSRGEKRKSADMMSSMRLSTSLINYQYGLMTKASALAQKGDFQGAERLLDQGLLEPGKCEERICEMLLGLYEAKVSRKLATGAEVYRGSVLRLSRLYQLTGNPFYQYRLGIVHMAQKERKLARDSFAIAATRAPVNSVYRLPAQKLLEKMSHEP